MLAARSDCRWFWMGIGLAAGLAVAFVWPHEHAAAVVGDRNDKFAMVTAQMDVTDFVEGVFVLDFLTGQLRGASINPATGTFTFFYARNVAADFNVDPNEPGTYAVVSGRTNLPNAGRIQRAASCVYVAELNSGRVIAYSFTLNPAGRGNAAPVPLQDNANIQFREAVAP